ncbi:hypothetical protein ELH98_01095 [Rhizobium ruizarguesonis]|uniref:Uncharacterized protein n=1 Tax=Rhizobium ruizarguesonis TaxID=2081791 RepID=A0ABY1X3L5_9HYPH|nr:hypothetical protein ELH98_01095 [Rhizobium ruizarguesonis]
MEIEMVQVHDSLRSKKSRDCLFAVSARRRDPASSCGSRRGFSCNGTEQSFRERALDARTEGTGLTSTDPAFFDDADLADDTGFGNGGVIAPGGSGFSP